VYGKLYRAKKKENVEKDSKDEYYRYDEERKRR
jgi:hypothetical protein